MDFPDLVIPPHDLRIDQHPKWLREHVASLRRVAERAVAYGREAHLATRPLETDTVLDIYDDTPVGLPRGRVVYFTPEPLDDGGKRSLGPWIGVRVDRDSGAPYGAWAVRVTASERVMVLAEATNSIVVALARM